MQNLLFDELCIKRLKKQFLIRICNERLESAERKVRILTETADGTVTDLPFDDVDEN